MELKPGDKLGPYEIVSSIGKGGMGEVWKARDPRLNRDVAIKVSAKQFTDRFEREAQVVASLNHTNICTLHDVGPNYLVMELVEGPTLAERIAQGPIPLEEALGIAKQIADALEAAHEKGIVHRDLKPANIKIKPDGSVKVLDFGLAKSGEVAELTSDSPTALTVTGMILGTAGYMAPEQARGQTVDKRADIWAFGVALYEMVTGKRLFEGETVSDSLAAVLTREPDLKSVPENTRLLLQRCLEKDPRRRLRDIGDAMPLVDTALASAAPSQSRFGRTGWIAAGVVVVLAGLAEFGWIRSPQRAATVQNDVTLSIVPPSGKELTRVGQLHVDRISPDGPPPGPECWMPCVSFQPARVFRVKHTAHASPFFSPLTSPLIASAFTSLRLTSSSRRKCFRSVGSEIPRVPMQRAISAWGTPTAARFCTVARSACVG